MTGLEVGDRTSGQIFLLSQRELITFLQKQSSKFYRTDALWLVDVKHPSRTFFVTFSSLTQVINAEDYKRLYQKLYKSDICIAAASCFYYWQSTESWHLCFQAVYKYTNVHHRRDKYNQEQIDWWKVSSFFLRAASDSYLPVVGYASVDVLHPLSIHGAESCLQLLGDHITAGAQPGTHLHQHVIITCKHLQDLVTERLNRAN